MGAARWRGREGHEDERMEEEHVFFLNCAEE